MEKNGGKNFCQCILPVAIIMKLICNDKIKPCCFSIQSPVYGYVTGQNNIPELILIFVYLLALILE